MWRISFALAIVGLCINTAAGLPGSGTEADPWRIESLVDFDDFAADANYWAGYTRMETDVNLAGRTYSTAVIAPDTTSSAVFQGTSFTGVFDGNDHKIINLTISGAYKDYLGLFGFIYEGKVKNLGLKGSSISGIGDLFVGSLVGRNEGSVSNCYSIGDVSGYYIVGGLVGKNYCGTVSDCYSTGNVTGGGHLIGGLVGSNYHGSIVSNCYSTSNVDGFKQVGGLVGDNYEASVSRCYSTGNVHGYRDVGGLIGVNGENGSVSNCHSSSNVNATESRVGGLVGENWDDGSLSNCYSTGDVSGENGVGGLVGQNYDASVSHCYSIGDVGGEDMVGGLVGENFYGSVGKCYSTGSVSGDKRVGGLVGRKYFGTVSNCYSTGDVSAEDDVGGLVGHNNYDSVSNCYSTGDVSGTGWDVGGLMGTNWDGSVRNCYSTGDVSGGSNIGGLVGKNSGSHRRISYCFWDTDTQTHGVEESIGYNSGTVTNVVGLSTAEMQIRSTFSEEGWDFVEIWLINDGATYPVLRQELRSDLNGDGGVDLLDFAIFADHWLKGKGN